MSHLPQWLQSCLQQSHLAFAVKTLDSREAHRESAKSLRTSSPSSRTVIPLVYFTRPGPSSTSHLADYYSCSVGQRPVHKHANRYLHLEPYDRTRVLVPNPDPEGRIYRDTTESRASASDARYINANWVREIAGGKWWIGGQAPLPNTAHAFLTLTLCPVAPPSPFPNSSTPPVHARRAHTIVQLTRFVEGNRHRAHPYFPKAPHQTMIIEPETGCDAPPIHVYVAKKEVIDTAQCVKTDLRLRWWVAQSGSSPAEYAAEEREVTHLLYTGWPDFGVPEVNHSILNFVHLAEQINNRHLDHPPDDPNDSPPILVHCSAGVGRTGSFIALCSLLRAHSLLASSRTLSSLHPKPSLAPPLPVPPMGPLPEGLREDLVAREIDGLREQRTSMVQSKKQAVWVYEALKDAFNGM